FGTSNSPLSQVRRRAPTPGVPDLRPPLSPGSLSLPPLRPARLPKLGLSRALDEMPVMPEAARIEPGKDAGRPHTRAVCGRPRTPDGDGSQPRQTLPVFLLSVLSRCAGSSCAWSSAGAPGASTIRRAPARETPLATDLLQAPR